MDPFAEQTPQQIQQTANAERWHAEMKRRSDDLLRVSNPFTVNIAGKPFNLTLAMRPDLSPDFSSNGDYFVSWEQGRHRIPFNGTSDVVRYIADKFTREMAVHIINAYVKVEGEKLLARAGKEKPDILLDKYLENQSVWMKLPRTDDEKLLTEIYPQLQLGIVHKFGMDAPTDRRDATDADFRTPQERAMASMGDRFVIDEPAKIALEKEILSDDQRTS